MRSTTLGRQWPRVTISLWLMAALAAVAGAAPRKTPRSSWTTTPVGSVSVVGSSTASRSGRVTAYGEGTDIWGTSDGFQFVYQSMSGDGQIAARLTGLADTDGWAKAGLMIRGDLTAGAAHAALLLTPANGLVFEQRPSAGAQTTRIAVADAAPVWLRVIRRGSVLTAQRSSDGSTWTTVGAATVSLSANVLVGLAVTSHKAGVLTKATFDNVALGPAPAAAAPTGPIAAWSFDDGAGPLARASIGGLDGVITGATWTTQARNGMALSFDGIDNLVTVSGSSLLNLTSGMTLEAWTYPTLLANASSVVVKEGANDVAYGLYARTASSPPAGVVNLGSGAINAAATAALPVNAWSHLAVTYDGSTVRVFVNGSEAGHLDAAGSTIRTSGALRIGGNSLFGDWFQGVIDDVRVYDRALDPAEIQSDMKTAVAPPPPDTTLPSVAITSPTDGATVAGAVGVVARATDNIAVESVQFLLNGTNLGAAVTTAPYSVTWDTTQGPNGTFTLAAVARDVFGNANVSANVSATVSNASPMVSAHYVQFESPDQFTVLASGQPAISSYVLEVWSTGADPSTSQPYATSDLGKPVSSTTQITIDMQGFFSTLPKGQAFFTTVTANGPGGASRSAASNDFMMQ